MKQVANSQETVVRIPVVIPPIEVQVPIRVVTVEVRHLAVGIDLGRRTLYKIFSITPLLVLQSMIEKFRVESNSRH